jgi:hypothetical protein
MQNLCQLNWPQLEPARSVADGRCCSTTKHHSHNTQLIQSSEFRPHIVNFPLRRI